MKKADVPAMTENLYLEKIPSSTESYRLQHIPAGERKGLPFVVSQKIQAGRQRPLWRRHGI